MASTSPSWAFALARFGLGARPGDGARAGDPRDVLRVELENKDAARLEDPALRASRDVLAELFEQQKRENELRKANPVASPSPAPPPITTVEPSKSAGPRILAVEPGMMAGVGVAPGPGAAKAMKPEPKLPDIAFRLDAGARFQRAVNAQTGFVERLVAFWSNHFCVSIAKGEEDHAVAGAFEREAIRPHVLGRFPDMLRAVEQHPAMLAFLDNQQSAGPNSVLGHNRKQGLNENLAREILELHTMGVGSGYTQADVTQLACVITGWSIGGRFGRNGDPGAFSFDERAHEPLAAVMRGRTYLQEGVAQGEAALDDLAREPATADHIALKFGRHFVADDPPPALIRRLAKTFRDTDGDLAALARTLIDSEEAWSAPREKMRNPWELSAAAYRAFGREAADIGPVLNGLNLLGQPLWRPAGPNGFSDVSAAWISPEGMKVRVELAAQFVRGVKNGPKPLEWVHDILGPDASAETREAVQHAESVEQAYALLVLSPEFQRR